MCQSRQSCGRELPEHIPTHGALLWRGRLYVVMGLRGLWSHTESKKDRQRPRHEISLALNLFSSMTDRFVDVLTCFGRSNLGRQVRWLVYIVGESGASSALSADVCVSREQSSAVHPADATWMCE